MNQRGFTIVEVATVVIVISILLSVSMGVYNIYQNRAEAGAAKSLANITKTGAERYFTQNNEYPLASSLATYQTASSVINVPAATLDGDRVKFLACSGSCSITDTKKVYYLTKINAATTGTQVYTAGSCTITMPNGENGGGSFMITYYNKEKSYWVTVKSNNGTVTTSGTCYTT